MCSQYSPSVQDTLCVTFGDKWLNESWCQTQKYGHTNFDCSLSWSHLPEIAVALKHKEYSHTLYRVKPKMCIIYRMRNDHLGWLFLVTVDIIRDWLPQVTELPFSVGIELGRCIAPSTVFWQPYGEKMIIWGPFYGFKSKHLFRMNLMNGNTDNISHVPILTWPDMTSSLTSHGSVNAITQCFAINSFLVLSFDTKISHLKRRWKNLGRTNFMEICHLFQLMCAPGRQYHWKHFHGYFLIPISSLILLLYSTYQMV